MELSSKHKKLGLLILSDVFILSGFGLMGPIFAVFIIENLQGGSIVNAGLATTIFLVVKSSVQLPLSKYFIDKHNHKTRFLLLGTLLIISVPFIYITAKSITAIFVAQAIYGFGAALAYPAWFSLFTLYLDKKHKGFEYSVYSTAIGVVTAITAYLGAKVADTIGFKALFLIVGLSSLVGFIFLIALYRMELRKASTTKNHPFHQRNKPSIK